MDLELRSPSHVDALREDVKPAAFTGASTAVLGTVGGVLPSLVHSLTRAVDPPTAAWLLSTDLAVVAAIGLSQGIAATATALARARGRLYISPRRGFVGALAVGAFNGLLYFLQMTVPATELGWTLDILILVAAGAAAGWMAVRVPERDEVLVRFDG